MTRREFRKALRATPRRWYLTQDGCLRLADSFSTGHAGCHCPLSAVAVSLGHAVIPCSITSARKALGLRSVTSWLVVRAADNSFMQTDQEVKDRRELLSDCGVSE